MTNQGVAGKAIRRARRPVTKETVYPFSRRSETQFVSKVSAAWGKRVDLPRVFRNNARPGGFDAKRPEARQNWEQAHE